MERNWLSDFVGQRVTAITGFGEEKTETGELLALGDGWLQIEKDNGELLLIPSSAIRIVKLLDMTRTTAAVEMGQPLYTPLAPIPVEDQNQSPSGY